MMVSKSNRIAIYGNRSQADALGKMHRLFEFMDEAGFRVFVHPRFFSYLEENGIDTGTSVPTAYLPEDVSLVMSIGGDGTFLRTARWVGDKEVPILGVNTGHLGFLSSCGIEDAEAMLGKICRGEVVVEKRMVLEVNGEGVPANMRYALNEISLMRDVSSTMITVSTRIDGDFLAAYRGDGLIVSTPTGSTAYSLSAGGPIMAPTLDCICLCPVAPHAMTLRPFVAGGDSIVELTPESRSGKFTLSLDDRSVILPAKGDFKVTKAPFSVLLIRRKDMGFASVLREKLLWSAAAQ